MPTRARATSHSKVVGASVFNARGLQCEMEHRYPALIIADRISNSRGTAVFTICIS